MESYKLTTAVVVLLAGVCTPLPSAPHSPHHHEHHEKYPSNNCSVAEVVEVAEVCVPAFKTDCSPISIPVKNIVDKEFCYSVKKTVCTESVETIDNNICTYTYSPKEEVTEATSAEVVFNTPCVKQMVSVCSPGYDYGVKCKEVEQETCYNTPKVNKKSVEQTIVYPEPINGCVQKSIELPRIACEDIVSEVCITVPEIEDGEVTLEVCRTELGDPACEQIELTLPKESCIEIVYGYAHGPNDNPHH